MQEYLNEALMLKASERQRNESRARAAVEKIETEYPELAQIYADKAHAVRNVMGQYTGDELKEKIDAAVRSVEEDYTEKYRSLGLDRKSLEPQYNCDICRDTGYVRDESGRETLCPCVKQLAIRLAAEKNPLFNINSELCFESFDLSLFSDVKSENEKHSPKELMCAVKHLAEDFCTNDERLFYITGETGLGKTYLATCIANRISQSGGTSIFVTAYNMLSILKAEYFSNSSGSKSLFEECDLLVIDDLGCEPVIEKLSDQFVFSIVNERLISNKKTVIATNLDLKKLRERYSERLTSRLYENSRLVRLYGSDLRKAKGRLHSANT